MLCVLVTSIDCVQNFVKFFKQILTNALHAEQKSNLRLKSQYL